MKKLILILFISSLTFAQNYLFTDITSSYPSLPQGVKVFSGSKTSPSVKLWYIDVDLNNKNLAVRPYIYSSLANVPSLTQRSGAYAAINGGFFGGTSSLSTVIIPGEVKAQNVTALTRNGMTYPVIRSMFSINTNNKPSVDWNYHFGGALNSVYKYAAPLAYILNDPTPKSAPTQAQGIKMDSLLIGIGGAPVLVKNGIKNVTYNQEIMWGSGVGYENGDPRTAVGYTLDNHVIMMVVDGRSVSGSDGINLPDLADLFLSLGCYEAINLDGGGSSQMAVGNAAVNGQSGRDLPVILAVTHRDSLGLPKTPTYERIIDTENMEVEKVGAGWFESGNAGFYGTSKTLLNPVGDGTQYLKYNIKLPKTGKYQVFGWWVSSSNRATNTPYVIEHAGGTTTVNVNQQSNNSTWVSLGEFTFNDSTSGNSSVTVNNKATGGTYIAADAVRFISYDELLSVNENKIVIDEYSLSQNYPNPFNPVTTINYSLASESNVQIKVFNILGSEVKTLINEYQDAGHHKIMFNSEDLPSGIYLYTLKAGNFTSTRKMILLK